MQITLYKFSKLENSTKIPDATITSASFNCTLKESVSIMTPVIEFAFTPATSNPTDYNYMYIPDFHRYYFIDAWGYNRRCWVCNTHVDVMASFREDIFDTNAYILRSHFKRGVTGVYFNSEISDSTYPITNAPPVYSATSIINPLNAYQNAAGEWVRDDGVFVIGILNDQGAGGTVQYYAFTPTSFAAFMWDLLGSINWMEIPVDEVSAGLQKAIINPFQYIVSCFWSPFAIKPIAGTEVSSIRMGWYTFQNTPALLLIPDAWERKQVSLPIPRHPQENRGQYLNAAPYSKYTLKFYPFGTVEISGADLMGYNTLDLYVDTDLSSGEGILTVAVNNRENPIRQIKSQVLVPLPVAQIALDISRMNAGIAVGGAVGALNSAVSGGSDYFNNVTTDAGSWLLAQGDRLYNWITGSTINEETGRNIERPESTGTLKSTVSNVISSAAAAATKVDMLGTCGSRSGYITQNLSLSGEFFSIADENIWYYGRPLCKNERIGDMLSFIQCDKVHVIASGAMGAEQKAIDSYLMGGCYIE